jgi:hypothetical protein
MNDKSRISGDAPLKPPVRGTEWRVFGIYTLVERAVVTAM